MIELIQSLVDFILHIDSHINTMIVNYGGWTYAILFLIIFCETGLVVTPFLPGDSLLFAAGAFAARGSLNVTFLFALLWVAAVLGDNLNYWIGRYMGPRVFKSESRLLNKKYLAKAHEFYERHGGKAVILARFVPIVRTFAPFVSGVAAMHYPRFLAFDISGGLLWIGLFTFGGYFFGNIPAVEHNFEVVILAIIAVSVAPILIEFIRARRRAARA